ncbi:MAG TPA: UxaA family hydrolase [Chthoniobacteraceae bacterium]|nr:UxaA family hydrolase [Chthoniobacteraceae bacterium]
MTIPGYLRPDGRKGIRNLVVVAYLVECAHHVAREIVYPLRAHGVHLLGFPGCYPNSYAHRMLHQLCTHPNVGAVLLVSLGCEGFNRSALLDEIRASGRPADLLIIQQTGGTRRTIESGSAWVNSALEQIHKVPRAEIGIDELIIGTVCGGSDATSGITANPAVGRAFDRLVKNGARCIFEETGELIGCEQIMAARAARPELAPALTACVEKAAHYYTAMGHGSFAPGNADGGLTTQEEKSMGAYSKSGNSPIAGILKPGDVPPRGGLYLLDVVPDTFAADGSVSPRWGFPNISDIQEIGELIACGSHLTLFTTGRGSVVGSAISPVIKICANPETYRRLSEDMDVNAGRILDGEASIDEVCDEIYRLVLGVAAGAPTASEQLGHQEFSLVYKSFAPLGPECLPGAV